MARTKNNQRSASRVAVDVGATGTNPVSKLTVTILAVSVIAAIWAVAMMTAPGRVAYVYFYMYAEYYMGVLTLVSLSITIMVGLVSTDRLVLSIRQRVMLQSVHRTTGTMAVSALVLHLWTKTVEHHIRVIDIFIPFLRPNDTFFVGLGTISGYTLIFVMWTGIARARFIGRGKPWMWRSIHAVSYLLWPIALVHGLSAGRAAKSWVTVSYIICVLLVLIGLAVRISVSLNRRKDFASTMGTAGSAGMKPVGTMVPTSQNAKRPARRAAAEPEPQTLGPVAVLDTWQPASAPISPPPAAQPPIQRPVQRPVQRPMMDEPMPAPRQRRPRDDDFDYDEGPAAPVPAAARGRRRADGDYEEPSRGRRYAEDDEFESTQGRPRRPDMDDTSTRMRRPDMDDTSTRMRRPDMDDTSTRMRRPDMDDTSTRMRRVEMDDTSTRMRRVEMDDTSTRMRRPEVGESSTRMRRPDVGDTSARMRRPDVDDTQTPARRAEMPGYEEPAPRPRRYAEDDEPAPRGRRHADEPRYDDAPRGRRHAADEYDDAPRQRGSRYAGRDEVDAPRARRDRGADLLERADSGRHGRSEFVDFAEGGRDGDDPQYSDPNYMDADETPTLIDMASRRARRAEQQDGGRVQAGRGARRGGRARPDDDVADDAYWSQLRGEAN